VTEDRRHLLRCIWGLSSRGHWECRCFVCFWWRWWVCRGSGFCWWVWVGILVRRLGPEWEVKVSKAAVMLSNRSAILCVRRLLARGWLLQSCLAVGSGRGGNRKLRCCCDWMILYLGCRGFWLGIEVIGWVGFRVSMFCLLRRRDILSSKRAARFSSRAID